MSAIMHVSDEELEQRDRVKAAQQELLRRGVTDVKFHWAIDIQNKCVNATDLFRAVADFLETYLEGRTKVVDRIDDAAPVTRVEPFSDVQARDESWPPPAHRPRYIPFL